MREAQLGVPNPAGAPGEVSFFHFGSGRGGTPEANIERWYGQFQEPREALGAEVTRDIVGATVVHRFRASGTYLSGMPGGPRTPQPGTTLLATVLESDTGHVFVRFVAPTPLAQATAEDFAAMVEGAARR
jgi:hypothetical protein